MKKLITLFMLLVTIVTGARAAVNNTTVTKEGTSQKFIDVAATAASKGDEVTVANQYIAYTCNELGANTIKTVWYTQQSSSSGSSNTDAVSITGYRPTCNKYMAVKSNNKQTFYVTKCISFAMLYDPRGSNRYLTITATNIDDNTDTKSITNSGTVSSGTKYNVELTGLDASKFYKVEVVTNNSSDSRFYQVRLEATSKTVVSQDYAGVKKGDATLVENTDFTKDGNTITLGDAYKTLTAPTDFKLINHITYSDESTDNADVDVAFGATATEGYFVGTATIALTTYTVKVPEEIPASAPTITTDLAEEYNVLKGNSIELSIVAEGATSYQWWTAVGPIEGATSSSYTVEAGTDVGDFQIYYCAATNAAGTTYSSHAKVTTVGRADCELTNIQFSNGAYGAINSATYGDGTVAFPYSANGSVPTVVPTSIVVSAGATYALDGNLLTVTAEDGTTKKQFTINAVEMTPLEVDEDVETTTFTAVPSWAFNLYGYDSGKGVKFAKKVDQAGNMRIALGNTRLYMFISKAKSITLTSGTAGARAIKVYRNGVQLSTPTATAAENNTITIELDETAPNMILIESNQTDGDTGFTKYAIEAAAPTESVTIDESGVATYVTTNALDFSTQNGAFKAYVITGLNAAKTSAQAAEVTQVPAGTALLLKGAEGSYGVEIIESAEAVDNMLLASDGTVTGADDIFAYSKNDKKFKKVATTVTIPAGKAYLQVANAGDALDINFDGETAVEAIAEANEAAEAPVKVIKNGQLFIGNFNVAGQQVK